MVYSEEEQVRLKSHRSKQAITLAMQGRWREAVEANKGLLENFPHDIDAYNRLGKAHMELGEYTEAREAYSRAMELNPYNTIARKNLNRLAHLVEGEAISEGQAHKVDPQQFIEEIGKAGVVGLNNLGPPKVLARMVAGDRVYLKIDWSTLRVENSRGGYLGQVEPKQGQRLIRLMQGGNRYAAAIVSSAEDKVTVIIREVYQHPSQAGRPSFPARKLEEVRPYISDRMLRHELDYELPGYTIVGGDESEELAEEVADFGEENDNEE